MLTFRLRDFIWKAFENTGNIDTYIFYREIENKNTDIKEREKAHEDAALSKV